MKKVLIIALAIFLCGALAVQAEQADKKVDLKIEANIESQLSRDYRFDFWGISDLDMELSSQTYTVGCAVGIGNLTITPRIGAWDSEMEIDITKFGGTGSAIVENTAGLALGVSGAWLLAEPVEDLKVSLIGDYSYGHSTIDKVKFMNIAIDNPLRTDIYKNDLEGGIELAYSGIPMNGVAELGLVYSQSTIDIELANFIDLEMEAKDNLGLRPAISFEPVEGWKVSLEGKLIDQDAIGIRVSRDL